MTDLLCSQHGWLGHVFVHEAAHAVAAAQRRIPFAEVRILQPDNWMAAHDGTMLGGVRLENDAQVWVRAEPVAALEFVLAGAFAERAAFGHCLMGAHRGDLDVWRIGAGLTAAQHLERIEAFLGRPFDVVTSDVERWVADNYPSIRRVAGALAGVGDLAEAVLLSFSDDWRLSEAEVLALLA
ncbi:MAG: hypothetical protein M3137_05520 [Actinomycetota bacterium]|nr:hypothetical protein [Actinomycetota bacterium]